MTSAGPTARRAPLPRLLVALASAAALHLGVLVVVTSPRADADAPPAPANHYSQADVLGARAAGMLVGIYHKARPAMDPAQQAHAFADRLQSVGGPQLPPVLDLETDEGLDPAELADWTQVFLDTLAHRTGRAPIIYTYRYFWIDRMANTHRFAEFPLWLAEYGISEPTLPVIGGWNEWLFWQRSAAGEVPGFTDAVDLNVFAGTRDDLHAWLGHVEPAPASVPVPRDLPTPDGVRPPKTIEVPHEVVAQLPPGMR